MGSFLRGECEAAADSLFLHGTCWAGERSASATQEDARRHDALGLMAEEERRPADDSDGGRGPGIGAALGTRGYEGLRGRRDLVRSSPGSAADEPEVDSKTASCCITATASKD